MAIGDGGILASRIVLTAALETTPGTDATPAGADAILVEDFLAPTPEPDVHERPGLNSYAINQAHLIGKRKWVFSFRVPFHGSGAAGTPAELEALLQACGVAQTVNASTDVTYTPDVSQKKTCTIYAYLGNTHVFKATGCGGNVTLSAGGVGEALYYEFSMEGQYVQATGTTFPASLTYDSNEPPVFLGGSLTFGGGALCVRSLSLDLGAQVSQRPCFTAASGYAPFFVTKHDPSGSLLIELESVSDEELIHHLMTQTDFALDATIGSAAGNKLDIDAPICRLTAAPISEDGGIALQTAEFKLYNDSGNDFLTLKEY